jgi:hypothetical protein
MAWNVHLHVCFACTDNAGVAELARKHLSGTIDKDGQQLEIKWFLQSLAERTGMNHGPKGGLSLWGIIGNHTSAEAFCETLRPFWSDLLSEDYEDGPLSFERVLVFSEDEQSDEANAYEIGWDDDTSLDRKIIIKIHKGLPFSWRQS